MNQESGISYPSLAFVLFGILFFSLFFGWHTIGLAETKAECTVTLTPDQSIQKAVDKVQTGSVVCLEEGQWKEQVKINKSLTLKGKGKKTEIYTEASDFSTTTISIDSRDDPAGSVMLENLNISYRGGRSFGYPVVSYYTTLRISNCKISSNNPVSVEDFGLGFATSPDNNPETLDLMVSSSQFSNCGVSISSAYNPVKGLIENSIINNSQGSGIEIGRSGNLNQVYRGPKFKITVKNSVIKGNGKAKEVGCGSSGIALSNGAKVRIVNSLIKDNKADGIFLWQSAEATVKNSDISDNSRNGISLWDVSQIKVSKSKIVDNGESGITFPSWSRYFDEELKGNLIYHTDYFPSNIHAEINNNVITNNDDYGVMIYTDECPINQLKPRGMEVIGFWGKVTGKSNSITDNGKKDICPTGLSFLQSEEGGKYPPPEGSTDREEE